MSGFLGQLHLRSWSADEIKQAGKGVAVYTLTSDLAYQSFKFGMIVAPAGLVTDFASIPRMAWNIIDPEDPRIQWPSVIHDAIYSSHGKLGGASFTREDADYVLREAMEASGAGSFVRNAVYQAVRMGGGSHWK